MSDSLRFHGLQHASLPFLSLSPGICLNSCPLITDAIQSSHFLSPPSLPAFSLSQHQGLFQWVGSLHLWLKYGSFSISSSSEYSRLISFRIDWFDLLAVQETLKNLLQHHSLKVSILRYSAFFMVQLSHPYMTTEKTNSFDYVDLCRQSNVSAF